MKKKYVIVGFLGSIASIMIAVYSLPIFYAMPVVDDFNFFQMIKSNYHYPKIMPVAFSQALWMYKNMQGAWFTNILDMFFLGIIKLSPFGIRVYLLIAYLFFVAALYKLCTSLGSLFPRQSKIIISLSCFIIVLFCGMNLTPCREEMYWFTGTNGYTVPLAFAYLGLSYCFDYIKAQKYRECVKAAVLLWLSCGGALNVAGLSCSGSFCVALAIAVGMIKISGNYGKLKIWIPFGASFISALINVVAPGNYARLDKETGAGINIALGITNTIKQIGVSLYDLYKYQYVVYFTVVLFLVVIALSNSNVEVDVKTLVYSSVSALAVLFASFFPVCLGYGRVTSIERIVYLVDLEIVMALVFLVTLLGLYVRTHYNDLCNSISWITIIPIMLTLFYINVAIVGIGNMMLYKTFLEFNDGTLRAFSLEEQRILDEIKNSTEDKVVIMGTDVESRVSIGFGISDDPDWWVNERIAACFDKKEVSVKHIK